MSKSIIQMNNHLQDLVDRCKKRDALGQKELYDLYKTTLFGICRRYLHSIEDAEDVLTESFVKIFTKLDDYKGEGSFEGWIKKITVNEALMFLRKHKLHFQELDTFHLEFGEAPHYEDQLEEADIMDLFEQLPPGYRTVLNMYDVEGYKHKEIADLLGISINTSKSQLILARRKMKDLLEKKLNISNGK
ncbi:MAG: RNA polymerase sigma factor [Saprospiraceae bacterium]|nr:RNA polymerase sigma factor [Saprospiraceae bacterium]MBK7221155.1 RNA polymerase sigma factor [Saprospiraceae bacterium]MBK7789951.1 RNA polymerase sigma factor [Saprospiraceae bacterium]MBK8850762.1 RNA polymerase sigma factor [Saprospiraceae bacterium]MBK9689772.1 RNA polymerase sigma factor [Saprospiraceae bacterium]